MRTSARPPIAAWRAFAESGPAVSVKNLALEDYNPLSTMDKFLPYPLTAFT